MKSFHLSTIYLTISLVVALSSLLTPLGSSADSTEKAKEPEEIIGLNSPSSIPNSFIVVFNRSPEVSANPSSRSQSYDEVLAQAEVLVSTYGGSIKNLYADAIHGFAVTNLSEPSAHEIAQLTHIDFVESDRVALPETSGSQSLPPFAGYWGLDRIDQTDPDALDGTYNYPNSGYKYYAQEAFVLDTGIDAGHAEFDGRVQSGYNAVTQTIGGTGDCHGHGTAVAGVIGSSAYGVAKGAHLVPVRISTNCQNGSTTSSDIVEGINWVFSRRQSDYWVSNGTVQPAVLNLSYGAAGDIPSVRGALENLATHDPLRTVVVVAAGNDAKNKCGPGTEGDSVGNSPYLLNVGATEIVDPGNGPDEDWRAALSNFGPCVDLYAPGIGIRTTYPENHVDGPWELKSGTSFAAPFVSGAALLYAHDNQYATSSDIMTALQSNALQGVVEDPDRADVYDLLNIEFMLN